MILIPFFNQNKKIFNQNIFKVYFKNIRPFTLVQIIMITWNGIAHKPQIFILPQ